MTDQLLSAVPADDERPAKLASIFIGQTAQHAKTGVPMIGWWIVISTQTPQERRQGDNLAVCVLATWEVGPGGLDWLERLFGHGQARNFKPVATRPSSSQRPRSSCRSSPMGHRRTKAWG